MKIFPSNPVELWKGAWSNSVSYAVNQIVSSGGALYLSILPNINKTPASNSNDWEVLGGSTPSLDQVLHVGHTSNLDIVLGTGGAVISPVFQTPGGDAFGSNDLGFAGGSGFTDDGSGNLSISGTSVTFNDRITATNLTINYAGSVLEMGSGSITFNGRTRIDSNNLYFDNTSQVAIDNAGNYNTVNGFLFCDANGLQANRLSAGIVPTARLGSGTANNTAYLRGDSAWVNPLASPALTGTPTAPTAPTGTNTTQLATTAFVQIALLQRSNAQPLASFATGGAGTYANPYTGWQSAVTSTSNVTWVLGGSWFGITSALVITDQVNVSFVGDGINRAGFRWWNSGTTGTMFSINNSGDTWTIGNNLFGLTFDGTDASGHTVPNLVLLSGQRESRWQDVSFQNSAGSTGWPVRMEAVVVGTFTNVRITQHDASGIAGTPAADQITYLATPTNGIILDQRSSGEQCTCLTFNGLTVENLTGSGIGIYLKNAFESQFNSCTAEDIAGTGLQIDATNDFNVFTSCDFEANTINATINGSFNSFIGGVYTSPAVGGGKNQFSNAELTNTTNTGVANFYSNCFVNGSFADTGSKTYILNCQGLTDSLPSMGSMSFTDGASIKEGNNRVVFFDGGTVIGFGDIDNAYSSNVTFYMSFGNNWNFFANASNTAVAHITYQGVFFPGSYATASAPIYAQGGMYYDTTLKKLRIGGASGWETVSST